MEKQIKELLEESVSKLGIVIDSVEYVKEGSNYFFPASLRYN